MNGWAGSCTHVCVFGVRECACSGVEVWVGKCLFVWQRKYALSANLVSVKIIIIN